MLYAARLSVAILALAITITSCGQPGAQPAATTGSPTAATRVSSDLQETEWLLSSLNGRHPLRETQLTLYLGKGSLSGESGCNTFSGDYRAEGGVFSIISDIPGSFRSTAAACEDNRLMDQEQEYQDSVVQAARYRGTDGRLELRDGAGHLTLVYERIAPSPIDHTYWRLVSINGDRVRRSKARRIFLNFSYGEIGSYDDCNEIEAKFRTEGAGIAIGEGWSNRTKGCRAGGDPTWDSYTRWIQEASSYRVLADRMELRDCKTGRTLAFAWDGEPVRNLTKVFRSTPRDFVRRCAPGDPSTK